MKQNFSSDLDELKRCIHIFKKTEKLAKSAFNITKSYE